MYNRLVILFFLLFCSFSFSQRKLSGGNVSKETRESAIMDSTLNKGSDRKRNKAVKNEDAKIEMYQLISKDFDTIYVDTSLTVNKEYKFNYLRKDNFDLMQFHNIGQTYNTLSYDFSNSSLVPRFGARAKHFNYKEIEDIYYYRVPTPFTELMFKSSLEQGQMLESTFAVNTSERFNFSISYKGLRSLGKYQHSLTSTGNFIITSNYRTQNNRYTARAHIAFQDILNEENGGISDDDLVNFENGNPEFIDRSVFDPLFENAEGTLKGRRFHLEHSYKLIQKDTTKASQLAIGNIVSLDDKYYQFKQTAAYEDLFGEYFNNNINDKSTLENFYTQVNVQFENKDLGNLSGHIAYNNYNYGYNKLVILNGNTIINRLKDDVISIGGTYKNQIGKFMVDGDFAINVIGDMDGNYLNGSAGFNFTEDILAKAYININSVKPNYNYLLHQSDYVNYNWQNNFENVQTKQIGFNFISNKYGQLSADFTTINNYTYYAKNEDGFVKPNQAGVDVNYFRVKFNNEIRVGKFALNNTIRYQNVLDGEGILNVPQLSTRNTLYYSNHFFEKKALYLQTGITFSYFTKYNMNGYDPVLSEFYSQTNTEIGGFPRLDFFINAKVRQTRIYLKAEHFNSSFTGYNFYSAPNHPYRDFVVRFGLVWNFFL